MPYHVGMDTTPTTPTAPAVNATIKAPFIHIKANPDESLFHLDGTTIADRFVELVDDGNLFGACLIKRNGEIGGIDIWLETVILDDDHAAFIRDQVREEFADDEYEIVMGGG